MTDIVGDSLGGERNETRPAPLVPRDAVLQDFRFLPIDIGRLFGSRFHAIASDAEWRAGVTLWLKSYHQTPAGSLPNDDIELARLAEFGRNLKKFLKIKKIALHGWIECADGRLYHRVVAEKVNEAWTRKQMQRERSRKGNAKRWGSEAKHNEGSAHYATSDAVVSSPPRTPSGIPQASFRHPLSIPRDRDRDRDRDRERKPLAQSRLATSPRQPATCSSLSPWWMGVNTRLPRPTSRSGRRPTRPWMCPKPSGVCAPGSPPTGHGEKPAVALRVS